MLSLSLKEGISNIFPSPFLNENNELKLQTQLIQLPDKKFYNSAVNFSGCSKIKRRYQFHEKERKIQWKLFGEEAHGELKQTNFKIDVWNYAA